MTARWGALNARARGLATHLLGQRALDALAHATDLAAVGAALRRHGYPVEEGERSGAALELALRRVAAARLRVLARWSGARASVCIVLFEDEERRSLRAIFRGAAQGAPAETRLAGLVPTPALPERALRKLARQATPAAVAGLLEVWRHPYAAALLEAASADHPDLFRVELGLARVWAARARRAAAEEDGLLAAYVRETIDLENAFTALVLAAEGRDVVPKQAFLPGGERVTIDRFEVAVASGPAGAANTLGLAFGPTPLGPTFAHSLGSLALEDDVLRVRIAELARASRAAPLGPAPLLMYALRLRAEIRDVQRIVWGVALGAPPASLARDLVNV